MFFASDNAGPMHPSVLEAITRANRRIYAALTDSLLSPHRQRLDELLKSVRDPVAVLRQVRPELLDALLHEREDTLTRVDEDGL